MTRVRIRPKRRRTKARVELTAPSRVRLPKVDETGPTFDGYRGQALRKGTQVLRIHGRMPGTIKAAGPQQCEVQWANGVTYAECNHYLKRRGR